MRKGAGGVNGVGKAVAGVEEEEGSGSSDRARRRPACSFLERFPHQWHSRFAPFLALSRIALWTQSSTHHASLQSRREKRGKEDQELTQKQGRGHAKKFGRQK